MDVLGIYLIIILGWAWAYPASAGKWAAKATYAFRQSLAKGGN